tara:strand:- start:260 stop:751 length:492 start_codon:yes stop_codon:yes gene_type:complete
MSDTDRLNLQKMINANDAVDTTDLIKEVKHSKDIRNEVQQLLNIKKQYSRLAKTNPSEFDQMCTSRCNFLFTRYTDIFNKVKKDELDLSILNTFLGVLEEIEEGKIDQHEGSFKVGSILKKLYVDSALKKSEKLDEKHSKKVEKKRVKNISWKQFKATKLDNN